MVYSQAAGLNFDVDGRLLRSFITRPMKLLKPKNPTVHSPADLNKVEFAVFAYLSKVYKTPDARLLDGQLGITAARLTTPPPVDAFLHNEHLAAVGGDAHGKAFEFRVANEPLNLRGALRRLYTFRRTGLTDAWNL